MCFLTPSPPNCCWQSRGTCIIVHNLISNKIPKTVSSVESTFKPENENNLFLTFALSPDFFPEHLLFHSYKSSPVTVCLTQQIGSRVSLMDGTEFEPHFVGIFTFIQRFHHGVYIQRRETWHNSSSSMLYIYRINKYIYITNQGKWMYNWSESSLRYCRPNDEGKQSEHWWWMSRFVSCTHYFNQTGLLAKLTFCTVLDLEKLPRSNFWKRFSGEIIELLLLASLNSGSL